MELTDVRRLTGPNFLLGSAGAAAEIVGGSAAEIARALTRMKANVETLLGALGFSEKIAARTYPGGASIAITAPIDGLYAATSILENAWQMTRGSDDIKSRVARMREEFSEEADANLLTLEALCAEKNAPFLWDDDEVSVGLGKGRKLWTRQDLPQANAINWEGVTDIPAALVTGTNGKSTTVRLACAIGAAAGQAVASSSSDYVRVGNITLDTGDYSGPGGARMALRDPRADMAILETARGGLMRRGLPIAGIEACLITNVAPDHLGEYGITDVESLADAKFMVAKAVAPSGWLVLNHDDALLVERSTAFGGNILWYGLDLNPAAFENAAYIQDGAIYLKRGGDAQKIIAVKGVPITLGAAALYNVSNALGAVGLTSALGIDIKSMRQGLKTFTSTPENNPGRGNFMSIGGANILLDFAHNPDGVRALSQAVAAMPAKRRLFHLGQAGDRSDQDIIDITKAVHSAGPDLYIVKELDTVLRGREHGAVTKIILQALDDLGVAPETIMRADDEFEAVQQSLSWAKPDDLLVMLVYVERRRVLDYLRKIEADGWTCGEPLPAE